MEAITTLSASALSSDTALLRPLGIVARAPLKDSHVATHSDRRKSPSAKVQTLPIPLPTIPDPTTKAKQTKSRNGCHTCKEKRLKCDETKPQCNQCLKRNVTCQGYKKNYKWRSFEEQMADKKPQASKKKKDAPAGAAANARIDKTNRRQSPPRIDALASPTRPVPVRHRRSANSTSAAGLLQLELESRTSSLTSSLTVNSAHASLDVAACGLKVPQGKLDGPHVGLEMPHDRLDRLDSPTENSPGDQTPRDNSQAMAAETGQPELEDDLGLDFSLSFEDYSPELELPNPCELPNSCPQPAKEPDYQNAEQMAFVEDASDFFLDVDQLWSGLDNWSSQGNDLYFPLMQEPMMDPGSDEMLLYRFDRETCNIMSIRNGPVDNPWRTLVVPQASVSPVLFHAICAMAAFHGAKTTPELRHQGIYHFNNSLACLRQNVDNLPAETSLMTSIALAFAESWDSAISTGIDHIKAAKKLIQQSWDEIGPTSPKAKIDRFKFLCKTWIYIDVIARLTSVDDDVSDDFAKCAAMLAMGGEREVDPLMGCASSLFPIIGRVANLVRRVCKLETNSPAMVEQASKLKDALEKWQPPRNFKQLPDPTCEVQHSLQTAEAYRWATIMYLYQAVPELPSPPSSKLGSKVMKYLATVPLTSRTIITHIYPLLAAGCEATTFEDRDWVSGRWQQMSRMMLIGNIDSCADVVKEVWRRRDQYAAMKVQDWAVMEPERRRDLREDPDLMANLRDNDLISRGARDMIMAHRDYSRPHRPDFTISRDPDDINGSMDREYTVRGLLHWVSVMKDWKWEVLLG